MSYIALARKWRPRTFSQLVGQDPINHALTNSLKQQRVHHAYLFTGTRGVGKTSVARLLAKALNCEQGITPEPCLQCDACIAIEQGRFIDLIEIDGASRTRVEDTREILENVQYAPTNGRFKIYLIDEVHMLSQHSFNALLKTLEEPPSHVKFLLATTDPQKLPVTVLSRCLQFNLKHISDNIITHHLQHILDIEKISYDTEAISLLSKAAHGSMRDALSLLDQAIVTSNNHLRTEDVKHSLGYSQQDYALQLLQALAEGSPATVLTISHCIAEEGGHFHFVLDELLTHLHKISVHQILPNTFPLMTPSPETALLSTHFSPEDTQLLYQIALKGKQDIACSPTLAIGFEMILLRMYTFKPAAQHSFPTLAHQASFNKPLAKPHLPPTIQSATREDSFSPTAMNPINETQPLLSDRPIIQSPPPSWADILACLNLTGLTLSAAENAEFVSKTEGIVMLRVAKGHLSLFTSAVCLRLEQAFTQYYHETIKLQLHTDKTVSSSPSIQKQLIEKERDENATAALDTDLFFQHLKREFSAEIVNNSAKKR